MRLPDCQRPEGHDARIKAATLTVERRAFGNWSVLTPILLLIASVLLGSSVQAPAGAGDTPIRIYRGHGKETVTATTEFGNRATATCIQEPIVEVTFYADGRAEMSYKWHAIFEVDTDPWGGANRQPGPTHGNIECAAADATGGGSSTRSGPYREGLFEVGIGEDSIEGTYDDTALSGSWEIPYQGSAGAIIDGGNVQRLDYSGTRKLTFNLPLVWSSKIDLWFKNLPAYFEYGKNTILIQPLDADQEPILEEQEHDIRFRIEPEHEGLKFIPEDGIPILNGDGLYEIDLFVSNSHEGVETLNTLTLIAEDETLGMGKEWDIPLAPP